MSALAALLGRLFNAGTQIPLGGGINFKGATQVLLNTTTRIADVDVRPASIGFAHMAVTAPNVISVPVTYRAQASAGVGGTADDVLLMAADVAVSTMRILDVWVMVETAIGGSTAVLRTATGGGGSVLSSSFDTASTGIKRNNDITLRSIDAGVPVYLRRSHNTMACRVFFLLGKV